MLCNFRKRKGDEARDAAVEEHAALITEHEDALAELSVIADEVVEAVTELSVLVAEMEG